MIKVYTSSVIDAPADAVWARVRDFNGLPQWTPFVAESRIEESQPADRIGCVRNFRLRDGGVIRERLLTLNRYLVYRFSTGVRTASSPRSMAARCSNAASPPSTELMRESGISSFSPIRRRASSGSERPRLLLRELF